MAPLVLVGVACRAGNQTHREDIEGTGPTTSAVPRVSTFTAPSSLAPQAQSEARVEAISAEDLFRLIRNGARRGTVVNVWATWCAPCRREIPALKAETERFAKDGIGLLVVSVDEADVEKLDQIWKDALWLL